MPLINQFKDTFACNKIHFETDIFMSTKVIGDREKRGLISYLSASLKLYSYYILSCKQIANPFILWSLSQIQQLFLLLQRKYVG